MSQPPSDEPLVPLSRYRALERTCAGLVEDLEVLQRQVNDQTRRLEDLGAVTAAYDVLLGSAMDLSRVRKDGPA